MSTNNQNIYNTLQKHKLNILRKEAGLCQAIVANHLPAIIFLRIGKNSYELSMDRQSNPLVFTNFFLC